MLLNVVFAGTAFPPTRWSFLQVPSDANFCDTKILRQHICRGGQDNHFATFKTKIGQLQLSKSPKLNFSGGPVREGGNASLVVEVTSVRASPMENLFLRLRRLILILFFSFDSYCPQLSKSVFEIFISQKLRELWGSIPHRFFSKLW